MSVEERHLLNKIRFFEDMLLRSKDEVPFESHSILPYFPGYVFDHGKSTYRGEEVGEGGFAQGVPGMYGNAALLDISSMHPHSAIAEVLFGPRFTKAFRDIVEGRVSIKHEACDLDYDISDIVMKHAMNPPEN